eukprot:scaffold19431_cov89-Skeletonema_dohrnii-CCMP3373.AAC.1
MATMTKATDVDIGVRSGSTAKMESEVVHTTQSHGRDNVACSFACAGAVTVKGEQPKAYVLNSSVQIKTPIF